MDHHESKGYFHRAVLSRKFIDFVHKVSPHMKEEKKGYLKKLAHDSEAYLDRVITKIAHKKGDHGKVDQISKAKPKTLVAGGRDYQ